MRAAEASSTSTDALSSLVRQAKVALSFHVPKLSGGLEPMEAAAGSFSPPSHQCEHADRRQLGSACQRARRADELRQGRDEPQPVIVAARLCSMLAAPVCACREQADIDEVRVSMPQSARYHALVADCDCGKTTVAVLASRT